MYIQVLNPTDSRAAWKEVEEDYIPGKGELIVFSDEGLYNEINYKLGNGETKLANLPFVIYNFPNGKIEKQYDPLIKSFKVILDKDNLTNMSLNYTYGREPLSEEYINLKTNEDNTCSVHIKELGYSEQVFEFSNQYHIRYSIEDNNQQTILEYVCVENGQPCTHTYKFTTDIGGRPVIALTNMVGKISKICDQNGFVQQWEKQEISENGFNYTIYKGPIAKAENFEYTFYFNKEETV